MQLAFQNKCHMSSTVQDALFCRRWDHEVFDGTACQQGINLDSIFKSRDITLPTKLHLVKAMMFPLVLCECEIWTIEKAEHQRIDVVNCSVGEDSLSPLDSEEIKPVNPKRNHS